MQVFKEKEKRMKDTASAEEKKNYEFNKQFFHTIQYRVSHINPCAVIYGATDSKPRRKVVLFKRD